MVVFDTTVLLLILGPKAKPPLDPATNAPITKAFERVEHLIDVLASDNTKVVIPTPVLSEVLVHAGAAMQTYLRHLNTRAVFRIAPFDQKAAIEAAIAHRDALDRGGFRVDAANTNSTKTKIKFDRQIVAIAKAEGAGTIYSDDADVAAYGKRSGLNVYRIADLDLPPENPQGTMSFDDE